MTGIDAARPAAPIPAVGVVCWRHNDVLLVKRGRPPRAGRWSLPGGRIDWGETAAAAAARELREETQIDARLIGVVDVADLIHTEPEDGYHFVVIEYAAVWLAGEPQAGDDAAEAAFVAWETALTLVADARTQRVIHAARARRAESACDV